MSIAYTNPVGITLDGMSVLQHALQIHTLIHNLGQLSIANTRSSMFVVGVRKPKPKITYNENANSKQTVTQGIGDPEAVRWQPYHCATVLP